MQEKRVAVPAVVKVRFLRKLTPFPCSGVKCPAINHAFGLYNAAHAPS